MGKGSNKNLHCNLEVVLFDLEFEDALRGMMGDYFVGDFQFRLDEEDVANLYFDLVSDLRRGALKVHLLLVDRAPGGFCISLLDSDEDPACIMPGWGFIRDFFVAGNLRRKGFGSALFEGVRRFYGECGADGLYLTASPAALPFWKRMGFLVPVEPFGRNNEYCLNRQL